MHTYNFNSKYFLYLNYILFNNSLKHEKGIFCSQRYSFPARAYHFAFTSPRRGVEFPNSSYQLRVHRIATHLLQIVGVDMSGRSRRKFGAGLAEIRPASEKKKGKVVGECGDYSWRRLARRKVTNHLVHVAQDAFRKDTRKPTTLPGDKPDAPKRLTH